MRNRVAAILVAVCCVLSVQAEEAELPAWHHVVDVMPSERVSLPDTLPTDSEGRLVCSSCHGIEDIDEMTLDEVDATDPEFLRSGPYTRLSEFCDKCHDEKKLKRRNVHLQLNEAGDYDKAQCLFCHKEVPDPRKEHRPDSLEYQLPKEKLCNGCHLQTPHFNAMSHQVELTDKYLARVKRAEDKYEIRMPLLEKQRMGCITCHTAHEKGLLPGDRPVAKQVADVRVDRGVIYEESDWNLIYQRDKKDRLEKLERELDRPIPLVYQKLKSEVLVRLSAKNGQLCLACHQFEK